MALFLTNRLHRKGQQDLFADNVRHFDKVSRKKSDLRVSLLKFNFACQPMVSIGFVKLIKLSKNGESDWFQTARAGQLSTNTKIPPDPNLPQLSFGSQTHQNLVKQTEFRSVKTQIRLEDLPSQNQGS